MGDDPARPRSLIPARSKCTGHSAGGVTKPFYDPAGPVGTDVNMNINHLPFTESTHVLVLRFDNNFVLIKCHHGLLNYFRFNFFVIAFRVGGDGPEVMASGFGFRGHAMEAAHVEAAPLRIVQGLGSGIYSAGPNTQVADMKLNFLPSIDCALEWVGGDIGRRWDGVRHVSNNANRMVVTFYRHLGIHVNAGVAANGA